MDDSSGPAFLPGAPRRVRSRFKVNIAGAVRDAQEAFDRFDPYALRGMVSALPGRIYTLGYEASSRVPQRVLKENRPVAELVLEEGLLTETELNKLLELEAMIQPTRRQKAATAP